MQQTQVTFTQINDDMTHEHAAELERRETDHTKRHVEAQRHVAMLKGEIEALKQRAPMTVEPTPPTSPPRGDQLETSLSQLHRAHAKKLNEIEGSHSQRVDAMMDELVRKLLLPRADS